MKNITIKYIPSIVLIIALANCGKESSFSSGNGGGSSNSGSGRTDTTCILSAISQANSGSGTESSLSAVYNSSQDVTKITVYDSVGKSKKFEATFTYVSTDSVRLNVYQYFILDAQKRVSKFVTKSDMSDPAKADDYVFKYEYNTNGYLATKKMYVNNSVLPNFTTTYNYTNNLLTSSLMIAESSGNLKVMESSLTYNDGSTIKNWIYTFPDAVEGYQYLTVLNFGNRSIRTLKQIITKIYEPSSGSLLDTWTTNYKNYVIDAYGYVLSGEASGDLQEGIASFYGKTNFYYSCR